MQSPDFWKDSRKASQESKKMADLKEEVKVWENLLEEIDSLLELGEECQRTGNMEMQAEMSEHFAVLKEKFESLEFRLLFSETYDEYAAIVNIHSGTGGTDAQDWAGMLLRMVLRYCEKQNFKTRILSESAGAEAGIKSATIRVEGKWAYGYLKSEAGVHRLVRISPFDAEKMRHTSFALIEVIPELEDVEVELKDEDLRIDTYLASGHGGQSVQTTYSAVRVVHLPTGIVAQCQNERSQLQNKETALKILKSRLYQLAVQEKEAQKKELKGERKDVGWGSQIRSYVLHPYKLVKDHRTEFESADPERVLDGDLFPFAEEYLRWKRRVSN